MQSTPGSCFFADRPHANEPWLDLLERFHERIEQFHERLDLLEHVSWASIILMAHVLCTVFRDVCVSSWQLWASVYGEKHLETVKAITMIGKLLHRMQGAQAGLEWYRKELKIREELQGEMHPRTQQTRRVYTALLDAKLEVRQSHV